MLQKFLKLNLYSKLVLLLLAYVSVVSARVGPKTVCDGLMPTAYNNSYLYFDGNVGILHKELDDNPAPMTEYTISMWFRPH